MCVLLRYFSQCSVVLIDVFIYIVCILCICLLKVFNIYCFRRGLLFYFHCLYLRMEMYCTNYRQNPPLKLMYYTSIHFKSAIVLKT